MLPVPKAMRARKYSTKASRKIGKVMHEWKRGALKGGKGKHPKVTSRRQAIAIGISEARKAGLKVPRGRKRRSR